MRKALYFLGILVGLGSAVQAANEDYSGPFTTQALYNLCSSADKAKRDNCNIYIQGLIYGIHVERLSEEVGMPNCLPEITTDTARKQILDFINAVTDGRPDRNKDGGNWVASMALTQGHLCKK